MKLKNFLLTVSVLFAMSFQPLFAETGLSQIQVLRSQKHRVSILCEPAATLYDVLAQTAEVGKVKSGEIWYTRVANETTACFAPSKSFVNRRGEYFCQSDIDSASGIQVAPALPLVPVHAIYKCLQDNNSAGVGTLKPYP